MTLSEEPENHLFEAVFTQVGDRINQFTEDKDNRRFYWALLVGGKTTASSVVSTCDGVKKVWAGGDEVKALALTKLFTLLMLSQCYRWLEGAQAESKYQERSRREVVLKILQLFGNGSEDSIKDFFNFDTQFKYDLKYRSHMVHLGILLLAKTCDACGHKCIDWSKVSFPVKSMETLTRSMAIIDPAPIGNPKDITALWNCHATGIQAMNKYYEEQASLDRPATGNGPSAAKT